MIDIAKVKEVNSNVNIITRSDGNWTNEAVKKKLKHKGLEYLRAVIPLDVYNEAKYYGGKDFWTKNNCRNEDNYEKNKTEIKAWLKSCKG